METIDKQLDYGNFTLWIGIMRDLDGNARDFFGLFGIVFGDEGDGDGPTGDRDIGFVAYGTRPFDHLVHYRRVAGVNVFVGIGVYMYYRDRPPCYTLKSNYLPISKSIMTFFTYLPFFSTTWNT